MQVRRLKYVGNDFIQNDLRRLRKNISSLETDITAVFNIIDGLVEEVSWPPPYNFCGGLITEFEVDGERFICFKDRVPTVNPKNSPSNGCRLVYALGCTSYTFTPLLLFKANEEKKDYHINNKKYPLTSGNLGKIINEKFK